MKYLIYPYCDELEYIPETLPEYHGGILKAGRFIDAEEKGKTAGVSVGTEENGKIVGQFVEAEENSKTAGDSQSDASLEFFPVAPKAWKRRIRRRDVSFDYTTVLAETDGVVLADVPESRYMAADLTEKITAAIEQRKPVFCMCSLPEKEADRLRDMAEACGTEFIYASAGEEATSKRSRLFAEQECYVIGVGGMLEEQETLPVMARLAWRYRKMGYRVTVVSAERNATLFGFTAFPSEIYEGGKRYVDIIRGINTFYNELQFKHQPDIILTQIPGGLMSYSTMTPGDFGTKAYMVSQALSVDSFIFCTPLGECDEGGFEQMSTVFRYRFGFQINAVGIEARMINDADSKEEEAYIFDRVSAETAEGYVGALNEDSVSGRYYFKVQDSAAYDELARRTIL